MPVIAIAGNKGGAGKTTLAINLACAFAEESVTVLLDADPQQSACQWGSLSTIDQDISFIDASQDLVGCLSKHQSENDYLLIDCPPSVHSAQTRQALVNSDLVLIPVLPSPLDLWASVKIEAEVARAREENPDLMGLLVVNQLEPRTKLSQAIRRAVAELELQVAETAIYRRMVYRSSLLEGRSVLDTGARGAAAVNELKQLINEMRVML